MNEIIALKTTVIAQQMYKQYATLEQMIKQLKVMLEKEVLKASVQVAGGTSSDDDTSTDKVEFENCGIKTDETELINCLRANLAKYEPFVTKGNTRNDVRKAMTRDAKLFVNWGRNTITSCSETMNKDGMQTCYSGIAKEIAAWNKEIKDADRDKKLIDAIYRR